MTIPNKTSLQPGANCWRIERATQASVVVDAADYFRVARAAMLKARQRIMLVGWDFDARIVLGGGDRDGGPATVGEFIYWLVENNPRLEVFLLRWDMGALKAVFRGSTILTILKWMRHPRIHTKLDGSHPTGASHHQKIVVIDDCFAFCGGIDMTGERWDTRRHLDNDAGRHLPNGKPYKPWHDATCALEGPVAAALGELCRDRWERAGCKPLPPVNRATDCWPDELGVDFEDVDVAISRAEPEMPDRPGVLEVEQLYIDQIASAKTFIYAENQYFASRKVAEAMAKRLDDEDCPEIVLVQPLTSEGWLQPIAMDTARARLIETLRRRDRHGRLRVYHPYTTGGEPIYVHAKILIVDDSILRVGSSNMNNRSMRLDTECDVTIDAAQGDNAGRVAAIRSVRDGLIAEHLGLDRAEVSDAIDESGSIIATIERFATNRFRPYETPELPDIEKWLADNEVLDPEGPGEMFEALNKRGLFRRLLGDAGSS
jgi:phosphatidylserine/phosphatidylglycerophosphate/cardiolipin synthase-like enzyme